MVSEEALEEGRARVRKLRAAARGGGGLVKGKYGVVMAAGEAAAGAAVVGFLRGKAKAGNKSFEFMGAPLELIIGGAFLAYPMFKQLPKLPIPKGDLMNVGVGILAYYAGSYGEVHGEKGTNPLTTSTAGAEFSLPHRNEFPAYGSMVGNLEGLYANTSF